MPILALVSRFEQAESCEPVLKGDADSLGTSGLRIWLLLNPTVESMKEPWNQRQMDRCRVQLRPTP